MSDVIDLSQRRVERSPHREGKARCLNCKHEWHAVAPAGVVTFECPSCHTNQGVFMGISMTQEPQWQCRCGEWTFFIDAVGPYCAHCGIRPELPTC